MPRSVVARRFVVIAQLATFLACAVLIAGCVLLLVMLVAGGSGAGTVAGVGLAVLAWTVGLAIGAVLSRPHARALRTLGERFPAATVFLIRRRPAAVSDTQAYIASRSAEPLPRGWLTVVADERGLSGWTSGREPRELALIGWDELGEIAVVEIPSVGSDFCVNTELRARVVPLSVDLGFASGIVLSTLSRRECGEVVELINSYRPADAQEGAGPLGSAPS